MYKDAIIKRFIRPLDRSGKPYVGVELELPIVNLKRTAFNYDAVQEEAEAFI